MQGDSNDPWAIYWGTVTWWSNWLRSDVEGGDKQIYLYSGWKGVF